jgi:hypothetical protein
MPTQKKSPQQDDSVTPGSDLYFIRLIRPHLGEVWDEVKPKLLAKMPPEVDPDLLAKYVDDSPRPSIHLNSFGVEPRFYAHRTSRRLLEFYRSK